MQTITAAASKTSRKAIIYTIKRVQRFAAINNV